MLKLAALSVRTTPINGHSRNSKSKALGCGPGAAALGEISFPDLAGMVYGVLCPFCGSLAVIELRNQPRLCRCQEPADFRPPKARPSILHVILYGVSVVRSRGTQEFSLLGSNFSPQLRLNTAPR